MTAGMPPRAAHEIRGWRTLLPRRGLPDGATPRAEIFVVDCGPSAEKVVSGLVGELYEEPWRDPRDYVLIDERGSVAKRYTVTTWSIEDELGTSVYAVADGTLRNLRVSVFCCNPVRVKRDLKVVVDGLEKVTLEDQETLDFLANALARDRQALAGEAKRRDSAAQARITAIRGADQDYRAGEKFRLAQEVLRSRVRAYDEPIDRALLGALVRFGVLYGLFRASTNPGEATLCGFEYALDAFAIACRLAAFDRSLEKGDADPPPDDGYGAFATLAAAIRADLEELEIALGGLERDLLQKAEWQEWSDANLNAMGFRSAAAHVSRSRKYLAKCLEDDT